MELVHEFVLPATSAEAWSLLSDTPRVTPHLPGAEAFAAENGHVEGTVTVRVGTVEARYGGTVAVTDLDEPSGTVTLDAKARQRDGRGSAAALVRVSLHTEGRHHTRVRVATDLSVTGTLARFGRTAIADAADDILAEFAANLADLLGRVPPPRRHLDAADAGPSGTIPAREAEADPRGSTSPALRRYAPIACAFAAGMLGGVLSARLRRHARVSTPLRSR